MLIIAQKKDLLLKGQDNKQTANQQLLQRFVIQYQTDDFG